MYPWTNQLPDHYHKTSGNPAWQQKPQEFSPGHCWVAILTACPWRRWHPVIEELFGGARFGNPNLKASASRMKTSDISDGDFCEPTRIPGCPKLTHRQIKQVDDYKILQVLQVPKFSGYIKKDDPRVLPRLRDLPVSRCAIAVPPWDRYIYMYM